MGDGKSEAAKPDWFCRFCKGKDGPYKNFGHRITCNLCRIDKGKSFLKAVERATRAPTTTLAERQAADAKRREKTKGASKDQQRILKLEAQLAVAQKQAKPWGLPAESEEVPADALSKGPTLDQLLKVKAVWDGCGEAGKEESDKLATQIAGLREAALATKPGHVQIRRADQRVDKARAACSKHVAKSVGLQAAMVALQKDMAEFSELKIKEDQELLDAEAAYGSAVRALHETPEASPGESAVVLPAAVGFEAMCMAKTDDFFAKTGTSRAQAKIFIDFVVAAEKAEEQAREDAKLVAATAAAAEKENARQATEDTSADGCADDAEEGDAFMSDILAGLDGETLDPTVKRSIEAAQEVAKRRKLLKKK
jgi:hypothetical protein